MRTTLLASITMIVLAACGDSGGGTTTSATATDPSTTNVPSDPSSTAETGASTSTTTSPTTGAPETTSPITETSVDPSTDPSSSSTTKTTTETDTGESTAGESTAGESSSTTDPDTTTGVEPGGGMCKVDGDCKLLSDCCRCVAIADGDPVPPCDVPECFITTCDALMIDEVSCRFGTCVTEKLNCDDSAISCDEAPPVCPNGQLPGVNANGTCWTQGCIPVASCNVVPTCADCPKSQMCVIDETIQGQKHRCEPIPPECMGQPTCACAGDACDTPSYETCAENQGGLLCSCPNC